MVVWYGCLRLVPRTTIKQCPLAETVIFSQIGQNIVETLIFRDEKSSEHGSSDMNGGSPSLANNVTDPDRDAKLREIVSHIYQYVSRQYGLRQMTQQSGVSNLWILHVPILL